VEIGPDSQHQNKLWKWSFYSFCGIVISFLLLPIFIIVPISFSSAKYLVFPPPGFSLQWYANFFSRQDWTGATLLSFKIAIFVTITATTLGTLAALGIVRGNFKYKNILYAFIMSPMIMPLIIVALASYFLLAKMQLIGSMLGLILIHTVISIPIVVVIVSNTLKNFDTTLEKAAAIMGAGRIRTFMKVTFPLIRTGVLSAGFFTFLTSFDELVIALFLGGATSLTLPRRMWQGLRMEIDPTIAAVATLLVLFSICILGLIMIIQRIAERRQN
jgi:putative spermidine/putrescine transport system permease protein